MRKQSRAMDSAWALEVMRKAPYITVSFIDADGKAYGLPLSLATDDNEHWYFHGALEGKKLDAIKAHPEVCLSAVTKCAPTIGPKDGSFTLQYKSAIAFGKAELVEDDAEKIHALRIRCIHPTLPLPHRRYTHHPLRPANRQAQAIRLQRRRDERHGIPSGHNIT